MLVRDIYLSELPDEDLGHACRLCLDNLPTSVAFCTWMILIFNRERFRRRSQGREMDCFDIPTEEWSDEDVAEAIVMSASLSRLEVFTGAMHKALCQIDNAVSASAALRLKAT